MPRRRLALALVLPALALGACTQQATEDSAEDFQGEQRAVAQLVEDLQEAGAERDGNAICERLVTRELATTIQTASKEPCAQALDDALSDADAFELTVEKVAIDGDRATATVTSEIGDDDRTETLTLQRQGQGWRLAELGAVGAAAS